MLAAEIKDLRESKEKMIRINEKLEASNHQYAAKVHELKTICAESLSIQENYRQSCIENERIVGEIRAIEEARRADKDQIANLTEKTSYLV